MVVGEETESTDIKSRYKRHQGSGGRKLRQGLRGSKAREGRTGNRENCSVAARE